MRRALAAIALASSACAFVPPANPRLDEARAAYRVASEDPEVVRLAPRELGEAREALELAVRASDTLQDPTEVDHLAYLAMQRSAISREVAEQRAFGAAGSRP